MTSPIDSRPQPPQTASVSSVFPRRKAKLILQSLVGLAAMGVVGLYAFSLTFTTFAPFDDEGYFLQAYREFLSGRTAYDQIFAFYGPFTFYGGALIAHFNANHVTHDNFRWALLILWIAIAGLMAGVVWRWSGQFSPAIIAFFLIGFRLLGLAVSSGHPQVWVILAVALLLWMGIDWIYLDSSRWRAFGAGVLLGWVTLCKINIGIFVCLAVVLAASLLLKGKLRRITSVAFLIVAIGLGLTIFIAGSTVSERYFALFYILSLTGTVAVAIKRPSEEEVCWRNFGWLAAGFGACVFVGIGLILLLGTTTRALFDSLITYPALLAKSYHLPFWSATERTSMFISIGGVSAAIAVFYGSRLGEAARAWLGSLKIAAGIALLLAFIRWPEATLTGSFLFLWLLLIDDPPLTQLQYANRLLLIVMSLLFSLQLFPVAGTQLVWAELLPIVAAALLLADGTNFMRRNADEANAFKLVRFTALWAAPLFAALLFVPCGKAALSRYRRWHNAQSLGLPGAHWIRLTRWEADRLRMPVNQLRQHCRVVLTVPGMYSYSLWSGVPPMEAKRINSWPFMWPEEVIKEDLLRLQQEDGACALVNLSDYQFFKSIAASPGEDKILSEIQRTMSPLFVFEDITLYGNRKPSESVQR